MRDEYSGSQYSAQESRDGSSVTGGYSVLLPDGRTQRVTFSVDGDSGFVADVQYEGTARPYVAPEPNQRRYEPAPAPERPQYQ